MARHANNKRDAVSMVGTLQEALGRPSVIPGDTPILKLLLEQWKKDHCDLLGHPLEVREGYALFCMCGERFGAAEGIEEPQDAGEDEA